MGHSLAVAMTSFGVSASALADSSSCGFAAAALAASSTRASASSALWTSRSSTPLSCSSLTPHFSHSLLINFERAEALSKRIWNTARTAIADPHRFAAELRRVYEVYPGHAPTHDRLVAVFSHLPHVLANVLASQAAARLSDQGDALRHVGPSFRDMTRVAGANTAMWSDIYRSNRAAIAEEIRAFRRELDEVERFETRDNIIESGLNAGIGVLSMLLAGFGGARGAAASGMCYWLVAPAMTINGFASRGARKRLKARLAAAGAAHASMRPAPAEALTGDAG